MSHKNPDSPLYLNGESGFSVAPVAGTDGQCRNLSRVIDRMASPSIANWTL